MENKENYGEESYPGGSSTFPANPQGGTDAPNQTIFENMFEPTILSPWKSIRQRKRHHSNAYRTILLNDENVDSFGNVSHIGWKGRVDYALVQYNEQEQRKRATRQEIHHDPNRLLNITVATIILLAQNKNPPKEYYMFTELYLKSITNEYGRHPYNIRHFLKHLKYLKKRNKTNWGEMTRIEPPEDLVVAKLKEEDVKNSINRSVNANQSLYKNRIKNKSEFTPLLKDRIAELIKKGNNENKNDGLKDGENIEYLTANSPVTSDMFLPLGSQKQSTPKKSRKDKSELESRTAELVRKEDNEDKENTEYLTANSPVTSDMFLPLGSQKQSTPKGSRTNI